MYPQQASMLSGPTDEEPQRDSELRLEFFRLNACSSSWQLPALLCPVSPCQQLCGLRLTLAISHLNKLHDSYWDTLLQLCSLAPYVVLSFIVGFTSQELEECESRAELGCTEACNKGPQPMSEQVCALLLSVQSGTVYGLAPYMAQACGMLYFAGA